MNDDDEWCMVPGTSSRSQQQCRPTTTTVKKNKHISIQFILYQSRIRYNNNNNNNDRNEIIETLNSIQSNLAVQFITFTGIPTPNDHQRQSRLNENQSIAVTKSRPKRNHTPRNNHHHRRYYQQSKHLKYDRVNARSPPTPPRPKRRIRHSVS